MTQAKRVTPSSNIAYHPTVFHTTAGTPYLKNPGIVLVGWTDSSVDELGPFLDGLGGQEFTEYLDDDWDELPSGERLTKFLGQVCYASFGNARTKNEDAPKYFQNVKEQKHGTLFGHAYATLFIYGVSRSLTHELVRHKVAWEFSQLSQRYVGPSALRFVERPEFQDDSSLHKLFEYRIDADRDMYADLIERLVTKQENEQGGLLHGEKRRDLRKRVQQTARAVLPNETETFLGMTGNVRAWRTFFELRATEHAETEIRGLAVKCYEVLSRLWPDLLSDYRYVELTDGTTGLETDYTKV